MNKSILDVGIHTYQINTPETINNTDIPGIDFKNVGRDERNNKYKYKFNSNTYIGEMIRDLETFIKVKCNMITDAELKDFETARVDIAVDSSIISFESNAYLNKLLIQLIGIQHEINDNNDIRVVSNRSNKQKSNKIKSKEFDIENYDKAIESPNGNVLNRLEFRFKQLYRVPEYRKEEFCINKLIRILDESITKENFDKLVNMNTETLLYYIVTEGKKDTAVLSQNIDLIISKKQITEIFTALGYKAPDKKACKWIYQNKPFLFKLKDAETYSELIKKSLKKFM